MAAPSFGGMNPCKLVCANMHYAMSSIGKIRTGFLLHNAVYIFDT